MLILKAIYKMCQDFVVMYCFCILIKHSLGSTSTVFSNKNSFNSIPVYSYKRKDIETGNNEQHGGNSKEFTSSNSVIYHNSKNGTIISKGMSSRNTDFDSEDEKRHILIFNTNNLAPWQTGYLNRTVVEEQCSNAFPCWVSDAVVPLCGTDNQTYLNPGVFRCAQKCNKSLKIAKTGFGPCPGHKFPEFSISNSSDMKGGPVATLPHVSSKRRVRVNRTILSILNWFGFHVHNDGGFYLSDEKKYQTWWNFK